MALTFKLSLQIFTSCGAQRGTHVQGAGGRFYQEKQSEPVHKPE